MKIILKPLTPIWTGNNDGLSDQLRISGLIGSLRWWWEGMVRAYGRYACDPTEGGCIHRDGEQICAACRLFGTTGWARRFRLTASGLSAEPWYIMAHPGIAKMHQGWLTRVVKESAKAKVLWGDRLVLNFAQQVQDEEWTQIEGCVRGLLKIVAGYGAIGAKAQNGHGVVGLMEKLDGAKESIEGFLNAHPGPSKKNDAQWFNLARTVFMSFEVSNPGIYATNPVRIPAGTQARYDGLVLPAAYEIRYKSETEFRGRGNNVGLRPALKSFLRDQDVRAEDIVGSTAREGEDARSASRVFVTHLYRSTPKVPYRFRVWAHAPDKESRDDIVADPLALARFIARYVTKDIFPGSKPGIAIWEQMKAGL